MKTKKKTTFTCPFGTFAFKRMQFGLCNTPAKFQRYMLSIFTDMVEHCLEVFMDDLTVFGISFDDCRDNLEKVLKGCVEKKLVLNWKNTVTWLLLELFWFILYLLNELKLTKQKLKSYLNCHNKK